METKKEIILGENIISVTNQKRSKWANQALCIEVKTKQSKLVDTIGYKNHRLTTVKKWTNTKYYKLTMKNIKELLNKNKFIIEQKRVHEHIRPINPWETTEWKE